MGSGLPLGILRKFLKIFLEGEMWSVVLRGGSSVWGGSQIGGRQKCLHLLKYQRLSAKKEVIFCKSKSGYFCWSNYAIFQGITTVWKRFISLIQKTFETGSKQWASFFTTYTDLVYLQNVFKRYKRQNTGHIPGKKSAGNKLVYTVFLLVEQCDFSGTNHSLKVLYNINS